MNLRPTALGAAVVLLTGCATGMSEASRAQNMLRLAGSRSQYPTADLNERFVTDTLRVLPQRALEMLLDEYERIGMPLTYLDPDLLQLGGTIPRLGNLAGESPSVWVDCGGGLAASSYADEYQVALTLVTRVVPLDSVSRLDTVLRASARPRDVSATWIQCRSLGTLERRVSGALAARVPQ